MELECKLQENTQKKMLVFEKLREKSENKIFHHGKNNSLLLLKIIIEYLRMLFNYKVDNLILSVFTVLGALIYNTLVGNSNNNLFS